MTDPARLVVFAPNWLGDAVMALPAVADIRRHFPAACLAVAVRARLAPLFEWVTGVNEVLPLANAVSLRARIALSPDVQALAGGRFDAAILLPNSFHAAWLACRARIPERWGYRRDWRGPLLTRPIRRPAALRHQAEYYQALTASLGMANGPRTVRLDPPAGARVSAADLLRSHGCRDGQVLVGMAPGAAYGRAKRWLPGRFAELIARLGREAVTSVLVGSKEDVGTGTEIERSLRKMRDGTRDGALSVNLIGRTDLGALAGVITMCRTFVSNDSGAMHVAAAVGVPVTAIFGASDERATSPLPFAGSGTVMAAAGPTPSSRHSILTNPVWCRPCMLRECPIDHRCMAGIPAERVFDVVMGQIRHGDA